MPAYTRISWDRESRPLLVELQRALNPFGVQVHEDPSCEGSDSYGYVFSRESLTAEQLAIIAADED